MLHLAWKTLANLSLAVGSSSLALLSHLLYMCVCQGASFSWKSAQIVHLKKYSFAILQINAKELFGFQFFFNTPVKPIWNTRSYDYIHVVKFMHVG